MIHLDNAFKNSVLLQTYFCGKFVNKINRRLFIKGNVSLFHMYFSYCLMLFLIAYYLLMKLDLLANKMD